MSQTPGTTAEQITSAWKDAMRSGDTLRRDTLSGLRAAIKNLEIESRGSDVVIDDAAVQKAIEREAKKRRDAIEEYEKAGRPDRAESERAELAILAEFLPEPLTDEELEALVQTVIGETGATKMADMGRVMQALVPRMEGRADGKRANAVVRRLLS